VDFKEEETEKVHKEKGSVGGSGKARGKQDSTKKTVQETTRVEGRGQAQRTER